VEADAAGHESPLDCIVDAAVGDVDVIAAAAKPGRLHVEEGAEPAAATSVMDDGSTLQFLDIFLSYEEEETLS
jgi:hypothetical protein